MSNIGAAPDRRAQNSIALTQLVSVGVNRAVVRERHEHRVTSVAGGARLSDIIEYEPLLGALGRVLAPILIQRRLGRLFAYRHHVTREWCERVE